MGDEPNQDGGQRPNRLLVAALFGLALAFYVGAFFLLGD